MDNDTLSGDPLYVSLCQWPDGEFKPLGAGPATYRTIPRSNRPIDARTLGYFDPRTTIDYHIARREQDEDPIA